MHKFKIYLKHFLLTFSIHLLGLLILPWQKVRCPICAQYRFTFCLPQSKPQAHPKQFSQFTVLVQAVWRQSWL